MRILMKITGQLTGGKLSAFTLTELLVVLVIVGILVLMALPSLMPLIGKTRATEAKLQLKHLYELERTHFYANAKYSMDFAELGFEHPLLVDQGGEGRYQIEVMHADGADFLARATAVQDFDGDGIVNVWEIDSKKQLKEITPD